MRLGNLIENCKEQLNSDAAESYAGDKYNFTTTYYTKSCAIEIGYYKKEGAVDVVIHHDNDKEDEKWSSNVERYLEEELYDCVDWQRIEDEHNGYDEYDDHGFLDALDFNTWKF